MRLFLDFLVTPLIKSVSPGGTGTLLARVRLKYSGFFETDSSKVQCFGGMLHTRKLGLAAGQERCLQFFDCEGPY